MKSNLQDIFSIKKYLENINYSDAYRIAKEISSFLTNNRSLIKEDIFKRLKSGEPWEYIKGNTQFCGFTFKVTKDTLIPRVETEQLVYECKDIIEKNSIKNVVDVGTGSGCIILSLTRLLKSNPYSFYALDISSKALTIAKYNEKVLLEERKIKWLKSNLITNLPKLSGDTIIIANLPYIPTSMYENLDKSVKEYEPKIALEGGVDGLKSYNPLFNQILNRNLKPKYVYFETEESIIKESKNLVKKYFPISKIDIIKDCFDKDRFIKISL